MSSIHSARWATHRGRWTGTRLAVRARSPACERQGHSRFAVGLRKPVPSSACEGSLELSLKNECTFPRQTRQGRAFQVKAGQAAERRLDEWMNGLWGCFAWERDAEGGATEGSSASNGGNCFLQVEASKQGSHGGVNCSLKGHAGLGVGGAWGRGETTPRRLPHWSRLEVRHSAKGDSAQLGLGRPLRSRSFLISNTRTSLTQGLVEENACAHILNYINKIKSGKWCLFIDFFPSIYFFHLKMVSFLFN